jgi:hypothetical protein
MVQVEQMAEAALAGDTMKLRSLTQDFLRQPERLVDAPPPGTSDKVVQVVAAALIELLALRRQESAPAWALEIGATNPPLYLVQASQQMSRLRRLCETESPEPLRRRNVFAPPTFLEFA